MSYFFTINSILIMTNKNLIIVATLFKTSYEIKDPSPYKNKWTLSREPVLNFFFANQYPSMYGGPDVPSRKSGTKLWV